MLAGRLLALSGVLLAGLLVSLVESHRGTGRRSAASSVARDRSLALQAADVMPPSPPPPPLDA
eukprot:1559576-Prymnesium_polylepis.1